MSIAIPYDQGDITDITEIINFVTGKRGFTRISRRTADISINTLLAVFHTVTE